ncbi:glutathione S-transferase family protein [Ruixingdingia sedimenti]|uniref:Glutathione S-transferase family protein n=1 Tax=Ruixingdingia sedimenti TaxID=3073604 RepID=A0ABU1F5H2_9RHOB|nr:glutathione S-transferase family protein [Xinfangfangia sp. LG-4]MDR5651677.1 glutathione S-transferase family protein [Xinfangfangia sp. LG-4]
MPPPLTLYYRPGTCALGPLIALEECGAAYAAVDLSQDRAALLRINPRGKVPVLRMGDHSLRECVAILDLIAALHPAAGLMPRDPLDRAECLSLLAWYASTLHIDYRRFLKPAVFSADPAAHAGISDRGRAAFQAGLAELDGMLAGRRWALGDSYSLADGYALVFVNWAVTSGLFLPDWQALAGWTRRMLARPAVGRALARMDSPLPAWAG